MLFAVQPGAAQIQRDLRYDISGSQLTGGSLLIYTSSLARPKCISRRRCMTGAQILYNKRRLNTYRCDGMMEVDRLQFAEDSVWRVHGRATCATKSRASGI